MSMNISQSLTSNLAQAVSLGLKSFYKPMPMSSVEWADENFYLSAESSYIEGRWETLPSQVAILNSMGNDEIPEVNLMKSARVGYSQMLKAALAYMLEHKNRNQILFQPTDEAAASFMKAHIETMIRDVPSVKALAPWHEKKHRDNTMTRKRFSTKRQIFCLGGTAAKNYREKSVDTVIYDELAAFPHDVEKEGSPTFLGDRRLEGSVFRKSIRGSTPKNKGECQIERAFIESGMKLSFEIPCPHCEKYQALKWGGESAEFGFKWVDQDPSSVRYLCEECGVLGSYSEWMPNQSRGEWVDRDFGIKTKDGLDWFDLDGSLIDAPESVSFHIWTAYSPFTEWKRIVSDFIKAKTDVGKLKTFVNTVLGETWEDASEKIEPDLLYRRRERYAAEVPEGALCLTCAVDVQDDRLEAEVKGWGFGDENFGIEMRIFHGDPARPEIWSDLDDFLSKTFTHESGAILKIACTVIDSGGHFTQQVYQFVKTRERRKIFAIKGKGGAGRPIVSRPSTANKAKIKLFSIGTDTVKELVHAQLNILEEGAGYCHYPISDQYDEEYFKQLTSEERRKTYRKGYASFQWVKVRKRNEAFDLSCYNTAAKFLLNPNYAALSEGMKPEAKPKKQRKRMKVKGF